MSVLASINGLSAGIGSELPIGTVLMYDGTGIGGGDTADILTRTNKIAVANGDSFNFEEGDWYVCNGYNSTPNIIGQSRFVRMETTSGNTGGSNNAINVEHSHTGCTSTGTHSHTMSSSSHTHTMQEERISWGWNVLAVVSTYGSWFWIGDLQDTAGSRTLASGGGSHTHTINENLHNHGGTSTTGSSGTGANQPAYGTVIFVIKKADS